MASEREVQSHKRGFPILPKIGQASDAVGPQSWAEEKDTKRGTCGEQSLESVNLPSISQLYEFGLKSSAQSSSNSFNSVAAPPQRRKAPLPNGTSLKRNTQDDLLTSVLHRLSRAELELVQTRTSLEQQIEENKSLRNDLEVYRDIFGSLNSSVNLDSISDGRTQLGCTTKSVDYRPLLAESERNRQQVLEAKVSLKEYDMIWEDAPNLADAPSFLRLDKEDLISSPTGCERSYLEQDTSIPFKMGQLQGCIDELNRSVCSESYYAVSLNDSGLRTAQFQSPEQLELYIYSDGFRLEGRVHFSGSGILRRYEDQKSKLFIKDILDGYFPFELKEQYPEGISILVRDCHRVRSTEPTSNFSKFPGNGQRVGQGLWIWPSAFQRDGESRGKNECFLEKLSAVKITSRGEVFDVRGAVKDYLGPKSSSIAAIGESCIKLVSLSDRSQVSYICLNSVGQDQTGILSAAQNQFPLFERMTFCTFEPNRVFRELKDVLEQVSAGKPKRLTLFFQELQKPAYESLK